MSQKDWTLLVFMAGDNDLDPEGEGDIDQLKSIEQGGRINVVVQFDRADPARKTRRYLLRHGSSLISDSVTNLGETNTGDPSVLEEFLLWGIREYPAERYMVILWSHGAGVDDSDPFEGPGGMRRRRVAPPEHLPIRSLFSVKRVIASGGLRRKIAVDVQARDFLDNVELKLVFAKVKAGLGRPVDIVGMDACLMNMVEIAWQLRESVGVIVGSQDNEPGAGWPYDAILRELEARPAMTSKQLAALVVSSYHEHFQGRTGITQSAFDLAKMPAVTKAVDGLAEALLARLPNRLVEAAVAGARAETQQFANADFVDLYHLCERLEAHVDDPKVRTACGKVQASLDKAMIASEPGAVLRHGLSIYFPRLSRAPLYSQLDFASDCKWAAFLEKFIPKQSSN